MRLTSAAGWRRTSSTTIGTEIQPRSCRAANFSRSRRSASDPRCHSALSYSAATLCCGHAKSSLRSRPRASTSSYCSTGVGKPPSIITSRASLSIGDSARPSASGRRSRTLTMPRRPRCTRTARANSETSQRPECRAASSVASARGRLNPHATSTAVHPGSVVGRPDTSTSGAPSRRCTTRPTPDRSWCPRGLSTCSSALRSVSNP